MRRRHLLALSAGTLAAPALIVRPAQAEIRTRELHGYRIRTFSIGMDAGLHDVACDSGTSVWTTAQRSGKLILLDARNGALSDLDLGPGAAPHGVIVGHDGAAWVTESGQNAIARCIPAGRLSASRVQLFKVPRPNANLNTAIFDRQGRLWFTGQNGVIGRFEPRSEKMEVWDAPRGYGPYGITATPSGAVWYVSLAGNYLAHVDGETGKSRVVEPPTPQQGARRVWSDGLGRLWISEWNSGNVSMHDPEDGSWKSWKLPGNRPRPYAVFVDDGNAVWLTDFAANAILRLDSESGTFLSFPSDRPGANVRQLHGRHGEVWGAESGTGRLVAIDKPQT